MVLQTVENEFDQDQRGRQADGKVVIAELVFDHSDGDSGGGSNRRKSSKHDCYDQKLGAPVDVALSRCFEFLHRGEKSGFKYIQAAREFQWSIVWSEYTGFVGNHRSLKFRRKESPEHHDGMAR